MQDVKGSLLDRLERALPRGLAGRLSLARRDVGAVLVGLAGRPMPPVVRSRGWGVGLTEGGSRAPSVAWGEPSVHAGQGRAVRVREVVRETADAVSLVLEDPSGGVFEYQPGQFYTVCATVEGVALRRAYSASGERPGGATLRLTVKRVPGGVFSNWVHEHLREGEALSLLGPSGSFVAPAGEGPRHLVLVAGGSGITPLYAIACEALRREPDTRVSLVYGNRDRASVIFRESLEALEVAHPGRFNALQVLEVGEGVECALVGRLDEGTTRLALDALGVDGDALYFVCGPEPMRVAVRAALQARGVDPGSVREEVFLSPHRPGGASDLVAARVVTVRRAGAEREVVVRGAETILEAAERAGVALPSSCTVGGCGACRCRKVEGEVVMDEPNCLREDERASGAVLTCVGRPLGRVVLEVG